MTTHTPSAPRAVADLTGGTILATVEIAVPPERVFRALTAEAEIVQWWGSAETYRTTAFTADVRVGGRWCAHGVGADAVPYTVGGEFLEVDPPRTLVQTWEASWESGQVTRLTYRLDPAPLGTRVTLRHEGFTGRPKSCQSHCAGWEMVLGWLGAHLAPPPPSADRFFFVRLVPPRPTFALDMTAEERAFMTEHVAYWTKKLADGTAIVFGPVADPSGDWGMGVVRAADEGRSTRLRPTIRRSARAAASDTRCVPCPAPSSAADVTDRSRDARLGKHTPRPQCECDQAPEDARPREEVTEAQHRTDRLGDERAPMRRAGARPARPAAPGSRPGTRTGQIHGSRKAVAGVEAPVGDVRAVEREVRRAHHLDDRVLRGPSSDARTPPRVCPRLNSTSRTAATRYRLT